MASPELRASASALEGAPRGASLRANFSWTFVGNAVYSACQWGTLILLAKLGSPELVGQYALGLAIATPIIMFTNLQLRAVLSSDVRTRIPFRHYLSFRLLMTAAAMIAIAAIATAVGQRAQVGLLIAMVGFAQALEAISDIYYAQLQLHDHMDRIAKSMMVRGSLSVLAMGIGIWTTGTVFWGVVGLALVRAAVLFGYDMQPRTHAPLSARLPHAARGSDLAYVSKVLRPRWDSRHAGELLWLFLSMGVVALLVSLNTNIPRYFIQWSYGEWDLGIFSALAFLLSTGNLFVGALAQSAFVRLARHYADGELGEFGKLLSKLLGIGAVLGVGGILVAAVAGRELLTVLYRPEYAQRAPLLVWFMVAAGVGYLGQFLGYAMTAARHFNIQLPLFVFVAAVITAASYWLVPRQGLKGAILAQLLGYVAQLIGSVAILLHGVRRDAAIRVKATECA